MRRRDTYEQPEMLEPMRMHDDGDFGPEPFIVNIDRVTKANRNYRTALWTGEYAQLTLMSIPVGGEIGLEMHRDTDQIIFVVEGNGMAMMGRMKDRLNVRHSVEPGYAVFVPAGTWHNVVNTGMKPLKVYTVYAPPHHPHGTVQQTKEIADKEGY